MSSLDNDPHLLMQTGGERCTLKGAGLTTCEFDFGRSPVTDAIGALIRGGSPGAGVSRAGVVSVER